MVLYYKKSPGNISLAKDCVTFTLKNVIQFVSQLYYTVSKVIRGFAAFVLQNVIQIVVQNFDQLFLIPLC